jgi:hypothetical protein
MFLGASRWPPQIVIRYMAESKPQPLDYAPRAKAVAVRPWLLAASILLPTIIVAIGITAGEWPHRNWFGNTAWGGWMILGAALSGGGFLLLRAKLPAAALLLYLPAQLVWIIYFSLSFEGAVFGNWL